jgi:hypothetical protein
MTDPDPVVSQVDDESEFDDAFAEFAEVDQVDDQAEELEPEGEGHRPKADDLVADIAAQEAAQEEEDPYAGMTPEVKAKFVALEDNTKALQHTIDSDAGRVSAFQRKINTLERQQTTQVAQPSPTQISDAMKGSDAQWDQFKEDYPEVAKALDNRFAALGVAAQDSIDKTLAPVKQHQAHIAQVDASNDHKARINAVAESFPTWTDEVKKPEFGAWLSAQSPGVQALSESDDTQDASTLIGLYDGHLVSEGKPSLKVDPGTGVDDEEEVPAQTNAQADKRKQQLADGSTVPSKSARVDGTGEAVSDFDAAFKVFAKRKEAQQRQTA